jgi:asparagine synthase (glutamine-hydrolysing)
MSAIVGIYNLNGRPVASEDVSGMVEILLHRGGDSQGIWHDGAVGLGHCMLRTTPESNNENLPSTDGSGRFVITSDARLDNRPELLLQLGLPTNTVGCISDSELILHAYEKWGQACPEKLLGDFAFAIWDSINQTLFCARDAFGVKPFYYYISGAVFAFASEIKGLLRLPGVPRKLNEIKLADHLLDFSEDKESTFYDGILRLPPAHAAVITRSGLCMREYWSLDPFRELRLNSDTEYAEAFHDLFTEAVRCRLRSQSPIGSMLSGGLDSSSVTCTARNLLGTGERLTTFSAVFDNVKQCDERAFISAVLAQNHVKPQSFVADNMSPFKDWENVLWHQDEPITPNNLYLTREAYRRAKELGIRVILDGFDGDTTVSHGTGWFVELARDKRWLTLVREARGYASHFENLPPWTVVWWNIEHYGLNPQAKRLIRPFQRSYRAVRRRVLKPANQPSGKGQHRSFINEAFANRVGARERHRLPTVDLKQRSERLTHYRKLNWALMPNALEVINKASSPFSVDVRFPFWDRRLVEFCLALPPEQKIHRGWNRMIMRRALKDILPREVLWRGGKTDMTQGFNDGVLTYDSKRLTDAVMQESKILEGYVNLEKVRDALTEVMKPDGSREHLREVCKYVSLVLWLERANLDN